jgi:hypothetical protein
MTTAVASIGVSFDGTDCQPSDLAFFLEIVVGFDDSPEVRGEDVTIPYADGRVARPRRFDRRRILLEGFVMGDGDDHDEQRADYRANRRTLSQLFDPTATPATLTLTLEDGSVWAITARTLSLVVTEVVQSLYATVSVELEAVSDWEAIGS